MISHGLELVAQFEQAYKDCKQEYEIVKEDGTLEKWVLERDAEEMKVEILKDIENYKIEIQIATQLRDKAWEKLKDKNYDLVKAPKD